MNAEPEYVQARRKLAPTTTDGESHPTDEVTP